MSKELWIEAHERRIEQVAEELDIEYEEAEKIVWKRLQSDPSYVTSEIDDFYADLCQAIGGE